jgi:hypothetical protein
MLRVHSIDECEVLWNIDEWFSWNMQVVAATAAAMAAVMVVVVVVAVVAVVAVVVALAQMD